MERNLHASGYRTKRMPLWKRLVLGQILVRRVPAPGAWDTACCQMGDQVSRTIAFIFSGIFLKKKKSL